MAKLKSKQITTALTGSYVISGSLRVEGQTVFDSMNINVDSVVVSGSMKIIDQKIDNAIASSSLFIQNLGTIASRDKAGVFDLGEGFSG